MFATGFTLALAVAGSPVAAAGTPYSDAVLASGPVDYWRLGNATGHSPNEVSGRSTLQGMSSSAGTRGVPGAMLNETDTAYHVNLNAGLYDSSTAIVNRFAMTLEAWVRPQSATGVLFSGRMCSGKRTLVAEMDALGRPTLRAEMIDDGRNPAAHTYDTINIVGARALSLNEWHHVVAVAGEGAVSLLVDGQVVAQQSSPAFPYTYYCSSGAAQYEVGKFTPSMDVDEFAAYDKVLTLGDVRSHYRASGRNLPFDLASETFGSNPALWNQYPCVACAADPVDTRSGNLHMPLPGVQIPGRGAGLQVEQAYNSLAAAAASRTGYGWSSTLDMKIDTVGGLKTVTQAGGSTVPFEANGTGIWTAPKRFSATLVQNPGGTFTYKPQRYGSYLFSATGQLLSISDQYGNTSTLHYPSGSTEPDYLQDVAGRWLHFTWASGRLHQISDELPSIEGGPRVAEYSYDSNGDLVDFRDLSGGHWVFTYDASHRMLTMRKPRHTDPAKVIENTYDSQGRVVRQEDERDQATTFEYDTPAAGSTRIKSGVVASPPSGWTAQTRIDRYVEGRREETTVGVGTAAETSTNFRYDPITLGLKSVTDGAGKISTYELDPRTGWPLKATDPVGMVTTWTYDATDQIASETVGERAAPATPSTADQVTTLYEHDATYGHLKKVTTASGTPLAAVTEFVHGDAGHREDVTKVIDPLLKEWPSTYDAGTGYQLTTADPLGNVARTTYNNVGWPKTTTAPAGTATPLDPDDYVTTYAYDIAARTSTMTGPMGDVTTSTTDANGNVISSASGITVAKPLGDVTTYGYFDDDRLASVDPPGAGSKSYTYWPAGQQKTFTNELGATTSYSYDPIGRLSSQTLPASPSDPLDRKTTYAYDAASRLRSIKQPIAGASCTAATKVGCISYSYDDAGRPTTIDFSDPATPDVTGITYDNLGRRTASTAGSVTESWAWDQRSRLTSNTDANGDTVAYGWDANNNLTSITYPDQTTPVTRAFDDAGRLTSTTDWLANTTTFGYDANSNWITTTFPTGTTNVDTYDYDQAGRMTGVTWKKGATTLGAEAYDRPLPEKGMVATTTPTGGAGSTATTYGYDARDRLESATSSSTATYGYDAASNLTERADGTLQVFDPAQRLCWTSPSATSGTCSSPPSDATEFAYDSLGNRTAEAGPDGPTASYEYDQANRLTAAHITREVDGGEGQYHEVASTRILDTRTPSGTCLPSPCARLGSGTEVEVAVATSPIPSADVAAVVATVTIINPNADGFARVNPGVDSGAATINFKTGENINRFVVAPVTDGKISLELFGVGREADAVIDVVGYYTTASGATGTTYTPTSPSTRLMDTRTGVETGLCPTATCSELVANAPVTVQAAGQAGLPSSGVEAAIVSVTASLPATDGVLRVVPGSSGAAGTINFKAGLTTNDVIIVPLDSLGRFELLSDQDLDVVLDISGYLSAPGPGDPAGSILSTIEPARIADSRAPSGSCEGPCSRLAPDEPIKVLVRGRGGVPSNATAVVGFVSVYDPDGTGYLRVNPTGSGTGGTGTATIDYAGDGRGLTVIAPIASDGTITLAATSATDFVVDVAGYYAPATDSWRYGYGANGVRASKTDSGGAKTSFTWTSASALPLLLRVGNGHGGTAILYGPRGRPIGEVDGTSVSYLHSDQLGSIRMSTDPGGAQVSSRSWDSHGDIASSAGVVHPALGFAGQYLDVETGFQYLRARYYSPKTGQFLTLDPMVGQTAEPYGYAGSDPINHSDPSGYNKCEVGLNPFRWGGNAVDCVSEGVDAVAGGDVCINAAKDDECDSYVEDHPEGSQVYADFAGGMLDSITGGNGRAILASVNQDGVVNYYSKSALAGASGGSAIRAFFSKNPAIAAVNFLSNGPSIWETCSNSVDLYCIAGGTSAAIGMINPFIGDCANQVFGAVWDTIGYLINGPR